ncbi:MAG: hypothetical protein P1U85_21215 [Verrucomicrobiales bacterium]|nr:hypothetical protein [Verrucomicrobiales bacterium]
MKTYKKSDLQLITVKELQKLVREHNLHTNYIKNYSRLKKADLIDKFLEHYKKSDVKMDDLPSSPPPSAPASPVKTSKAKIPKRLTVLKNKNNNNKDETKPKPKRKTTGVKYTEFDKAMGIDKPLYSKEEGGLKKGARKQFENKYGTDDAKFLKKLGDKLAKKKENKKRERKQKKDENFQYQPQKKEKRKRKRKPVNKMNL